jgi:hypothetical protein
VVGRADVSLRPQLRGRHLDAERSSLAQYSDSSGIGKGAEEIPRRATSFGHAPVGAGTSTKALNVGIHPVDGGDAGSIRLLDGWGYSDRNRISEMLRR